MKQDQWGSLRGVVVPVVIEMCLVDTGRILLQLHKVFGQQNKSMQQWQYITFFPGKKRATI